MPRILFPSLAGYKKKYLKSDLIAALVATAITIPASLGLAVTAGLPPVAGLYTALLAPVAFACFARSKRLVVGADSSTAVLVAAGAALVVGQGVASHVSAVAALGTMVAALLVIMSLLRFGFLADVISRPVLVGFLGGIGVQLAAQQLPLMMGVQTKTGLWEYLSGTLKQWTEWSGMSVTIAILVLGVILLTRSSKIPGALVGLALAAVFAVVFSAERFGVVFVGALPSGLPELSVFPPLSELPGMVVTLAPIALSIALVIVAQSSAVIRDNAADHDEKVELNRDIFALGIANAVSSFMQGFVVNGSPPRTQAVDAAGGRTQMVNVIMAVLVGILLLVGAGLFAYVPQAALAAVVFAIGLSLIRLRELREIFATHKLEFVIALFTLLAVAVLGVRQGIFIAIVMALIERLLRQYHPNDQILLRDGELSDWALERVDRHHRHSRHPSGLLVYRFDSPIYFENAEYFAERLRKAIHSAKQPVSSVVVDAGAIDGVDYTAVEKLKQIYRHLSSDGVRLGFSHVSPHLREQFDSYGVTDLVGEENIFPTLSEAIREQPGNTRTAVDMVKRLDLPKDAYVMIGGGVLEAHGIRKTFDVDLVVSDTVYERFRDELAWKEYIHESGKHMLARNGYNFMRSWMGYTLPKLRAKRDVIDGVSCMNLRQLMKAKQRLGRKKDIEDIALIETYLADTHRSTKSK